MKALVTGVAGFIGSTLAGSLIAQGNEVRGIDCFTAYYDSAIKRENLKPLLKAGDFEFVEADLRVRDPAALVQNVDVVFHLAGQPGVRSSWEAGFGIYTEHNILATQRLLEASHRNNVGRFVYASSSSIYGNNPAYPTSEDQLPHPHSPYGVTKLAGEHLCGLYSENYGLPSICLRYFTVYGPKQRPDMAIHRIIESVIARSEFTLLGSGSHIRDFTFVEDVVRATILAGEIPLSPDSISINIAGGSSITMSQLLELIGESMGESVRTTNQIGQAGDVQRTAGSIEKASSLLNWSPQVTLAAGIEAQIDWHLRRHGIR